MPNIWNESFAVMQNHEGKENPKALYSAAIPHLCSQNFCYKRDLKERNEYSEKRRVQEKCRSSYTCVGIDVSSRAGRRN
jgi:hypothetical protein